jgi:OFA family oxalate/formate antiporter-like MFS transporter
MALSFTLQAMCLFLVVTTGQRSSVWFVSSLVAVYFTWGQIFSLFPATSGDYFGSRHATSNYAVLYTAKGVAAILGGWIAALLAEQSGSWALGFYGSAVMALVAAVMAVKLRSSAAALKAELRAAVPAG